MPYLVWRNGMIPTSIPIICLIYFSLRKHHSIPLGNSHYIHLTKSISNGWALLEGPSFFIISTSSFFERADLPAMEGPSQRAYPFPFHFHAIIILF